MSDEPTRSYSFSSHYAFALSRLVVTIPFLAVIVNSFKTQGESEVVLPSLPKSIQRQTYLTVMREGNLAQSFPLPNLLGRSGDGWNLAIADVVLTALPVIVIYIVGRRHIVAGLAVGSVKE